MQPSIHSQKVTFASLLVALGIIFGDIGTSPLYVLKAIVGSAPINRDIVLGGLSCIFWTLTLQTTIKYVVITLKADNNGEGGIFALYALLKRMKKKWLIFPAIIGGSMLLADGFITPPISVASAVEGLRNLNPNINTIPIIISILFALFFIQQFGTKLVGVLFGPVMLVWFIMLGTLGVTQIMTRVEILKAINPYYAYELLVKYPEGFWLLGAVFLCTTGAEALYSDLGHCGRKNIRLSWIFVKIMLLLNYFGQGAWLLTFEGQTLGERNPFYSLMPAWFLPVGIAIATAATIVASQALISGSFTLINEAIRLNFWPKVRVKYPTDLRGQLYIPSVNWLLCFGCIGIVLYFRESSNMEAAYGLAIVMTMIMTTLLLVNYLILKRYSKILIWFVLILYLSIETSFLIANLSKFHHGGWITILIATILISLMFVWYQGRKILNSYVEFCRLDDYTTWINELSSDTSIEKYATHLVYLTSANNINEIEQKIIYSIFQKQPKRADIYWLAHVDVIDEPYRTEFKVTQIVPNKIIRIDFKLGFRVAPRINLLFRQVINEITKNKEVDIISRYRSLNKYNVVGDFRFIVMKKFLSSENELPFKERIIMDCYFFLKQFSLSEEKTFGLDTSNVTIEKVPLIIAPPRNFNIKRLE
ncbi:MAG: KUP/HAK/KT family potassium transporter [Bacteroidetes bacterium]|nr:KUP/HAK/KT family potassium transporter [Bacteroidota bacterium]